MSYPPDPRHAPREFLRALFDAAVARAQPALQVPLHLPSPPDPSRGRTMVIGAGKASAAMAAAVETHWPADAPLSGLVVTRYGHVLPGYGAASSRVEIVEAAHPVPDETGVAAARRLLALAQAAGPADLVLCLVSGGASALLSLPVHGLTLTDKQALHSALLRSGATIAEMNTVRKHVSAIKGGRLAVACAPARVVTLLISDVPGDDPAIIGSGPTVPDPSTCTDALDILRRYAISLPPNVERGLHEGLLETPKPGDPRFANHEWRMIATPQMSLDAAAALSERAGLRAHVLSDCIEGESRDVGRVHAALARQVAVRGQPFPRPCVLLSGGETTVTVRDAAGRGGRASEFLLSCAMALDGLPDVYALAADTDGIDGLECNAGAIATPDALQRAREKGLSATDHLAKHDAYSFFAALDDLVVTGPTLTNVNDFRAILVL